jgi:hypothetical protein
MPLGDSSNLTLQSVIAVQWVLLSALAILVLVAYRQLAFFTRLAGNASTDGLALGAIAVPIDYQPLGSKQIRRMEFTGSPSFIVFADPGCPACERAIPLLQQAVRQPGFGAAMHVFSTASEDTIKTNSAFGAMELPIGIVDRYALEQFRVRFVPYAYLVGTGGEVLARGALEGEKELKSLLKPLKGTQAQFVRGGDYLDNAVLED